MNVPLKYPTINSFFRDKKNHERALRVKEVEPGLLSGREIRGTIDFPADPLQHGRNYATDQRTFWNVWEPA